MRLLLAVLLAAVLVPAGQAQSVLGTVTDSSGVPLPGATVMLSRESDGVFVAAAAADTSGAFRLPRPAAGAYVLRISFVGFETATRTVDVPDTESSVDLGQITLSPRESELGRLEVTADRVPVVLRGDTLVYDARAYDVPAGATVEELLREMPGIEVDEDGTIRARGRPIDRLTVDGRDFFGSTPSVGTRNLPADAVERAEVFDERPEGPDGPDGRQTLNLALRPERRQSAFGRLEGGAGADIADPATPRFAGRGSVNRFGPALRLSAIGSANNVSEPGLTIREYLGVAGMGDAQSGSIIQIQTPIPLSGEMDGEATSWTGGANATWDPGRGWETQASYIGYAARMTTAAETARERPAAAGTIIEAETNEGTSTAWVHHIEGRADRAFGDGHDLRLTTKFDAQGDSGASDVLRIVEGGPVSTLQYHRSAQRLNAGLGARYRRGLGEQWRTRAEVDASLGRTTEEARADATCPSCSGGLGSVPIGLGAPIDRTSGSVTASAVAIRSLGGLRNLEFGAEQTVDVQQQEHDGDADAYRRTHTATTLGAAFSGGSAALRFRAGANLAYAQRHAPHADEALRILPRASLDYTLAQNRTIQLRYEAQSAPTPVFKLHAAPTLLSPFQVHIGNPVLRDETAHTLFAQYTNVHLAGGSMLFGVASVHYVPNAQSYARTIDAEGITTIVPVNVGSRWSAGGTAHLDHSFQRAGLALRVQAGARYSRASEIINGQESAYALTSGSLEVRVRKRGGAFRRSQIGLRSSVESLTYGSDIGLSRVESRLNPYARLDFTNAWGRMRISVEHEVHIGSLSPAPREPLVEVALSPPSLGRISASLVASDLLNGGLRVEPSVTPGSVAVSRVETLGRRFIVRLTTTF